jgi:hypothetical protein
VINRKLCRVSLRSRTQLTVMPPASQKSIFTCTTISLTQLLTTQHHQRSVEPLQRGSSAATTFCSLAVVAVAARLIFLLLNLPRPPYLLELLTTYSPMHLSERQRLVPHPDRQVHHQLVPVPPQLSSLASDPAMNPALDLEEPRVPYPVKPRAPPLVMGHAPHLALSLLPVRPLSLAPPLMAAPRRRPRLRRPQALPLVPRPY